MASLPSAIPEAVRNMLASPDNAVCADCPNPNPDWASINLGIFVCVTCSGFHRNLGVHHSKVRSVRLDTSCWDEETVAFMQQIGNQRARQLYEYNCPTYYVRPSESTSPIVRENWIRAKYVKKEFMKACDDEKLDEGNPAIFEMPERAREGYMYKQNPRGGWQKRWFSLLNSKLYWFGKATGSFPKGSVSVNDCEVKIPEPGDDDKKQQHEFRFHVYTPQKLYTLACDNREHMFDWIHALRRAQIFYKKLRPRTDDTKEGDLSSLPNTTYSMLRAGQKEGLLSKQGGKFERFKERYCVLCEGTLYYFKKSSSGRPDEDAVPVGGVRLENCDVNYQADKTKKSNCFSLITPSRCYFFQADSLSVMKDWVHAIRQEIEALMQRETVDFRHVSLD